MSLKLAILASGNGSNAQAIFAAVSRGSLDAEVRLVLCNQPGAGVLDHAALAGIPAQCLDGAEYSSREAYDLALIEAIRASGADVVALAGYMRLLTPAFLEAFPGRILNIHPAVLPSFKGVRGAEQAVAYGVKISGCSVHFVSQGMDEGPLIIQAAVPVIQGESAQELQNRIHVLEHRIYPQALHWLAQDRLSLSGRSVSLVPADLPKAEQPPMTLIWPPLEQGF